jgi:YHS domain-containing protein
VGGLFGLLGAVPSRPRPTRADISGTLEVNYKLALNVLGLLIFGVLFWISARRGETDPVCGVSVDRARAISKRVEGETLYFCSEHCLDATSAAPSRERQHRRARRRGVTVAAAEGAATERPGAWSRVGFRRARLTLERGA